MRPTSPLFHRPVRTASFILAALSAIAGTALSQPAADATQVEPKTELQIATGHSRTTSSPVVIPEEKLLFTLDYHGEVKAWGLDTGKVLRSWPMKYGAPAPIPIRDRGWVILPTDGGLQALRLSDFSTVAT
jgi:hypothetical protein